MTRSKLVQSHSTDVHASNAQNQKTVECRLKRTYGNLAEAESVAELFKKLIKHDLATNDVKNFVVKQSIHKRILSEPDLKVQKVAMTSKLQDALASARRLRVERDSLKRRLAKKYKSRMSFWRRVQDDLVKYYREHKKKENLANNKKFSHIQQKTRKLITLRFFG